MAPVALPTIDKHAGTTRLSTAVVDMGIAARVAHTATQRPAVRITALVVDNPVRAQLPAQRRPPSLPSPNPPPQPVVNRVTNSSFGQDISRWGDSSGMGASAGVSAVSPHTGKYSYQVKGNCLGGRSGS
ncbi:uncharacterized protein PgNI_05092 [Pyricularia grisea]|uniref:Uncharacterized protein n=1 Tax=Pyricularia grisea TaxID=148305 RepID=A0A6P8BC51_PYRGI|nr:uncharacterized protein PgNI_05092 [Pyricularia grisea]TLD13410.1 hypothetical protein PgNI_05092 [Pyricularia grisea]